MKKTKDRATALSPIRKIIYGIGLTSAPWIIGFLILLANTELDSLSVITITSLVIFIWLLILFKVLHRLSSHWKSLANILQSFRNQDYSMLARQFSPNDPLGLVYYELNQFAQELGKEKKQTAESKHLLHRVLENVNVAIFLFDDQQRLVMVNQEACALFDKPKNELLNKTISDLNLEFAQLAADTTTHQHTFPAKKGQWLVKHSAYRDLGIRHSILFLADISQNLQQEERTAWQRLIRILSHEINNAITPLTTTTSGLKRLINKDPLNEQSKNYLSEGLDIIARRIHNLQRHVESYSQISRLPEPLLKNIQIDCLFNRVRAAFEQHDVRIVVDSQQSIKADEAQIEQVLVNLIKNAIEATPDNAEPVSLRSHATDKHLHIEIEDHGQGVENPENLFIPFFTTKPEGSGIGLFISMQIIQAHNGALNLENKQGSPGCIATISLPLSTPAH